MYGAGISSDIYLETDSSGNYYSYAGQNDQLSWKKRSSEGWDYGLNHEQYHFNITEVFARKMNQFINDNPDPGVNIYGNQFREYKKELRSMQNDYDDDTDHSSNQGMQRLWEYKIDSMLAFYSGKSHSFTDPYTGLSLISPSFEDFELFTGVSGDWAYRIHRIQRYDLNISVSSYQSLTTRPDYFVNYSLPIAYLNEQSISIDTLVLPRKIEGNHMVLILSDSSSNTVSYDLWGYNDSFLFNIDIEFDDTSIDSAIYSDISSSILSSFEISETAEYWYEMSKKTPRSEIQEPLDQDKRGQPGYECLVFGEDKITGVNHPPLITKNDSLIIPYQVTDTSDSLIDRGVLYADGLVFFSNNESSEHLFKIPINELPTEPFIGRIGYFLKSDSTEVCYQFYGQDILIAIGER
ncbi:MAG: hypothetical protein Roseis2KO_34350 [Roseivirga sp.]